MCILLSLIRATGAPGMRSGAGANVWDVVTGSRPASALRTTSEGLPVIVGCSGTSSVC